MDNIKVGIRVRPLHEREKESEWIVENNIISPKNNRQICYSFDHVFDDKVSTEDIYNILAKSIVESVVEGINGTIFAYGQTASGKTYTMMGESESLGIIPHCVLEILHLIHQRTDREFLIRVSFMEIYNETITDLLNEDSKNLQIRDGGVGASRVTNLTESPCVSTEDIIHILQIGNDNRTIGATAMNQKSSRSHSIFTISLESRVKSDDGGASVRISSLNLVDLAGSERTCTTGTETQFKEGVSINRSLLTLGNVISKLSEASMGVHIPYRESKLTRILQPSLGGNAKTAIICTVSPTSIEESHSTLRFASRAMRIRNRPVVNEVVVGDEKALKKQLEVLILQNQVLTERLKESCSEKEKTTLVSQLEDKQKETRALEHHVKVLRDYIVTSNNNIHVFDDVGNRKQISRRQTICPGFSWGPKTPELVRTASHQQFQDSPLWKGFNQPEVSDRRQTRVILRKRGVSFLPSRVSICSSTSEETICDEFDDYLEPLLVEKVDNYTQTEINDSDLKIRLFESESPPSSHHHISDLSEVSTQTDNPSSSIFKDAETQTMTQSRFSDPKFDLSAVKTSSCSDLDTDQKSRFSGPSFDLPQVQTLSGSSCPHVDLDQSYFCMHKNELHSVKDQLEEAMFVKEEKIIQIEELQSLLDVREYSLQRLKEELKKRELANQYQEDILCDLQTKLKSAKAQIDQAQDAASKKQGDATELAKLKEENIDRLKQQIEVLKCQYDNNEKMLQKKYEDKVEEMAVLVDDKELLEERLKALMEKIEDKVEEIAVLVDDKKLLEERLKALMEKAEDKVEEIAVLVDDKKLLEERLKALMEKAEDKVEEIAVLVDDKKLLEERLKALMEKAEDKVEEIAVLVDDKKLLEERLKALMEKAEDKVEEIAVLVDDKKLLEERLKALMEKVELIQPDQLHKSISEAKLKLRASEEERESLKSKLEAAITQIEQKEEIHNEDKICLKKYQEENSTLVNEKTVIEKRLQVQVEKLEDRELRIDELQQITKHWEEECSQNYNQIEELSNELDRKDEELEQMKRKIEQKEEIHNEDKICLKKYQEENSTLVNEKTVIEKQLQVQVEKLEDRELQIDELQQITKHWEEECSQNYNQIEDLSNELDRKDEELEQMKRKLSEPNHQEQANEKECILLKSKLKDVYAQIVLLKQDHDVIEKCLKQEYKNKMEENRNEKRLLEEKLQVVIEKVYKYEEEIPELKEQIEYLVFDFDKHQNQIVELSEELDEKDEALDTLRKILNETENVKPQEVQQLVKQLEDELKKRNNSIQSLEEEVFQLRKKSLVKPPVSTENLAQQVYELRTNNELLKRKLRQMAMINPVGYKPSVAVDGSGFITGMAYHEAAASNRQLRKEIEQHEIDYKKLKDEFISLREALEEESKELGRYRAERNKYRVKYDTLKHLTGGKGVSDLMGTQSTGVSDLMGTQRTGVSDLMGTRSTGVSDLMGTQRTESTNEENKKPESPKKVETSLPPFSIPDTGLISCDWEPSILDPGRGMFTFSNDDTPPKRTDCKQQ